MSAGGTLEVDHRTGRSVFSAVLQGLIRPLKPRLVAPKRTFPAGSLRLKCDQRATRRGVEVAERQHEGIWLYDLVAAHDKGNSGRADEGKKTNKKRMYYVAGGGWQSPPSGQHWRFCAELARRVDGLAVTVVSAPLAPASPADKTLPALRRLFSSLLGEGGGQGKEEGEEQVILAGDSSGANIVLSLALEGLGERSGTRRLAGLVVISPAVDLRPSSGSTEQAQAVARRDPVLTAGSHDGEAAAWAGDMDRADPRISPVLADVRVLAAAGVRLVGVTGGHDILTPAALEFRDACAGEGVAGAWLHWEGQMHCFPLAFMYGLPEAVRAKDWVVEQVARL